MEKTKAPTGLTTKSRRLWTDITSKYELRADELRLLEDACREADIVERLEKALAGDDLMVEGSQGQPVASPLLQEVRQHRSVLARLLTGLKLPEEEAARTEGRSESARHAAMARWGSGA